MTFGAFNPFILSLTVTVCVYHNYAVWFHYCCAFPLGDNIPWCKEDGHSRLRGFVSFPPFIPPSGPSIDGRMDDRPTDRPFNPLFSRLLFLSLHVVVSWDAFPYSPEPDHNPSVIVRIKRRRLLCFFRPSNPSIHPISSIPFFPDNKRSLGQATHGETHNRQTRG